MSVEDDQKNIAGFGFEIYMKMILFGITMLILIVLTGVFIYMLLNRYDWQLVAAAGGSDTLFGYIILHITKSLFRTS